MGTTPKTNYKYEDELDVTGGTIVVTKGSGDETVAIEPEMVTELDGTEFDSTELGKRNLKVTYGDFETEYEITVKDYVKEIKVTPETATGTYGDELSDILTSNNVKYAVVYAKAGEQEAVNVNVAMVENYNSSTLDEQTLTVKYTDNDEDSYTKGEEFEGEFKLTLGDEISTIEITAPTEVDYIYGEELDVTGGQILITYVSGDTKTENVTKEMITEDGNEVNMKPAASEYEAEGTNVISKTLTITYGNETKEYDITIKNPIDSIEIATSPKTSYNLKEETTGVGGTLKVTRKAGNKETVNIEDTMVSGLDTSVAGTDKTATVTYEEDGVTLTTIYEYDVIDNVINYTVKAPEKIVYNHGEILDVTGGQIILEFASGSKKTIEITIDMITEKTASTSSIARTKGTSTISNSSVDMEPDASEYGPDNTLQKELIITYNNDSYNVSIASPYNITIINDIKKITVTTEPKTEYKIGDTLNVDGGKITVERAVGEPTEVEMTNANVTVEGFESTTENTELGLDVSYTENGKTLKTSYNVSVIDTVNSIEIVSLPKQEYKYGEPLDVTGGKIKIVKDSGSEVIDMTESMIKENDASDFDSTKLGTRKLVVSYGGAKEEFEITVSDYVTGVVLTPPTKRTYEYGEPLNLDNGSVQKVMASKAETDPVPLTDPNVNVSGYNPNKDGKQTITVTYEGFDNTYSVEVVDNVETIKLNESPKTDYKFGENIDIEGLTITATKASGAKEVVNVTESMVSGYKPDQLGKQTVTITYKGATTTYDVNVEDYLKGIEIEEPEKLIYKINEAINLDGGKVVEVMASGAKTEVGMKDDMISGFDSTTEGAKTVTVTHKNMTGTFNVTIQDPASKMLINTLPDKTEYLYGENLDLTGATIEVEKESGNKEILPITPEMVSGYNPKEIGTQTIIVEYEGLKQEFNVEVKDYIDKLEVQAPEKTEYEYGEELDLEGGKVSIIMASGAVLETTELTASMISGYDEEKVGKQTIDVEYKDLKGNFTVEVIDIIKSISIKTEPDKVEYEYNEELDLTGATITVEKSSGTYTEEVTKDMVSGYNPENVGKQVITITYGGTTTNFIVTVAKKEEEKEPIIPQEPTKPENPINPEKPENSIKPIVKPEDKNEIDSIYPNRLPQAGGLFDNKKDNKNSNNNENTNNNSIIIIGVSGIALLALVAVLMLVSRKNGKIYVEDNGVFVLGGNVKVNKGRLTIKLDKFLDDTTKDCNVKVVLNKKISNKLNGYELKFVRNGNTLTDKINSSNRCYKIVVNSEAEKVVVE